MAGKDISKNKVFKSPYKDEIEKRLAVGSSPRSIAKWLETRGEKISYATINEYKKLFFDENATAGKLVNNLQQETKTDAAQTVDQQLEVKYKEKALVETQVNQGIAKIRAVNHISLLYDNIQDMREYLGKLQSYEPVIAAHAARGLYAEMRATIETLERLKEKEGADDNTSVAKLLSSIKKQKREMEKDAAERGIEL